MNQQAVLFDGQIPCPGPGQSANISCKDSGLKYREANDKLEVTVIDNHGNDVSSRLGYNLDLNAIGVPSKFTIKNTSGLRGGVTLTVRLILTATGYSETQSASPRAQPLPESEEEIRLKKLFSSMMGGNK